MSENIKQAESTEQAAMYTEAEALDVAAMLFIRKMRRLHTDAFGEVFNMLPEGARYALTMAEHRGDATLETPNGRMFKEWPGLEFEDEEED